MHNLDPNDMDALFREGAEKHEFTYNEDAWKMMEQKLDNQDRRRYVLWFLFAVLLIGSTVGAYTLLDSNTSTVSNIESPLMVEEVDLQKESATDESTEEKDAIEALERSINEKSEKINTVVDVTDEEEYINTTSKVKSSNNIGAQNSNQSEDTGSLAESEVVSIGADYIEANVDMKTTITKDNEIGSSTEDSFAKSLEVQNDNDKSDLIAKKKEETIKNNSKEILLPGIPSTSMPTAISVASIDGIGLQTLEYKKQKPGFNNLAVLPVLNTVGGLRYSFTGFVGSEFSSVGLFKEVKAGYKLGTKVGVQFSNKFQLDLGIAFSHKRYGSTGEAYTNDDGWYDDIMPTWMDAECNVFEIPLEMSYYFNGYKNNGFFVNAGISSFFLNSEWYGFKYDEEGMTNDQVDRLVKEKVAEEIETNYHLSGVGKISFGYQKIISPKMAIEVSPYLQIPLTGIGEGKVDLYSTGVQFAVKFNSK